MRRSLSPSSSPDSAQKRQRLSSPTYEQHFPITQEEVRAFDEAEKQLSQGVSMAPSQSRSLPSEESSDHKVKSGSTDTGEVVGVVEEDRDAIMAQEGWSPSPPGRPQTTQERAADDDFFSTDSGAAGSDVTFLATKPLAAPSKFSGFTSAAALPSEDLSPSQPRFSGGFTSAATLKLAFKARDGEATPDLPAALVKFGGFGPASALPVRAEDQYEDGFSSSPLEPPPQPDYDSWFDSDTSSLPPDASLMFKSARTVLGHSTEDTVPLAGFTSGLTQLKDSSRAESSQPAPLAVGFGSAAALIGGKSGFAAPSVEAVARAALMRRKWEAEDAAAKSAASPSQDVENALLTVGPSSTVRQPPSPGLGSNETPFRPALCPVENNGFSPAQILDTPLASKSKNTTHYTTVGGLQIKNKQFKSPLISRQPQSASVSSVRPGSALKPDRANIVRPGLASGPKLPAPFPLGATSCATSTTFAMPANPLQSNPTSPGKGKALGMTPRRVGGLRPTSKAKFSTPFKPGMAPGNPGAQLELKQKTQIDAQTQTLSRNAIYATPMRKSKPRKEYKYFDLNPVPDRNTLASSGLRPQSYTEEELCDMDINVEELLQMRPSNAIYYLFHSPVPTIGMEDLPNLPQLGPEAAFTRLRELGCTLATQPWVTNHYGLILWKLAGMVCLEPQRERDPSTKRWCWLEVIRQLRYRYERELNGGARPTLRLISTEDAPASYPMVLCVVDIPSLSSAAVDENGIPQEPHPELEVTDGWYRLRAKVDLPLARAIRRGLIRIGTKIAVSGAKLSGDRKEPCEILEAYDNTQLQLSGNATHLAPWHAKLGFVKDPFIATMDSLTFDGGSVPVMDIIVTKTYGIAYSELIQNEDGPPSRGHPHDEKEELKAHDQWLARRDKEVAKIRTDLERNIAQMEDIADRLRGLAGPHFDEKSLQDEPIPDHIEDIYTELMDGCPRPAEIFHRLGYEDAGWLRIYMLDQVKLSKERLNEEIEREIQHVCPPRDVRDFRVIVAKDARWHKQEPTRTAQITIQDPLRMVFSEGGTPGDIREGQRFMVTNLHPKHLNAWMAPGPGSMIYLISRRSTRWTNIKTTAIC